MAELRVGIDTALRLRTPVWVLERGAKLRLLRRAPVRVRIADTVGVCEPPRKPKRSGFRFPPGDPNGAKQPATGSLDRCTPSRLNDLLSQADGRVVIVKKTDGLSG